MFKTHELNQLLQIFQDQQLCLDIQQDVFQKYVNLEATILRAKVLRDLSPNYSVYLIQSHIEWDDLNLAYLFAPIILANLNQKAIYTTPLTPAVTFMLGSYYQIQQKNPVNSENVLESLNLYLDIYEYECNKQIDFLFLSLIKAICRVDIRRIFIISHLNINLSILEQVGNFLNVDVIIINHLIKDPDFKLDKINQKKLLFKRKDEFHRKVCQHFSHINKELIMLIHDFKSEQAYNLIEDMFYSEHIFEKISVYAEYVQTSIQNEHFHKLL